MDRPPRVLFLCTGNSCRSQMAEGWLRDLAGDSVVALSAGTAPQGVNPIAIEIMGESGIDISGHASKGIDGFVEDAPELVIAVCEGAAESCPTLPGTTKVLRWPFPDPAQATGTEDEIEAVFKSVSDSIRGRIASWLARGAPPLGLEPL